MAHAGTPVLRGRELWQSGKDAALQPTPGCERWMVGMAPHPSLCDLQPSSPIGGPPPMDPERHSCNQGALGLGGG